MNCRFCGTRLPEAAAFCGECGRSVPVAASVPSPTRREPAPAVLPRTELAVHPAAVAVDDSEFTCPQCSEPISEDDVFCGECGFVLTSSYLSAPVDAVGDPRDTSELDFLVEPDAPPVEPDAPPVEPDALPVEPNAPPVEPDPAVEPDPEPDPEAEPDAAVEPEPETAPPVAAPLRAAPDPFPWGQNPRRATVDLESTRIVAGASPEERFVLQFSTGESVTVSGAGLVGRNPASQPGEYVDQLVTIFDAGKSVSKTHLEFGQDSGRFWVSDRFSTNGSTVRQPDADPQRCEPGRRYFVARGTRVDIGEQFFVVS